MDFIIRYLTHPQVDIDPNKDVATWSLNGLGRQRIATLVDCNALAGTQRIISSAETKAVETATPLANSLACELEVRPLMGENDRQATGFLPPAEFETVADQFFANPDQSVRGWETASAAQSRILSEVQHCLNSHTGGDVLFVGHGAVGTLLYCALAGLPISRDYDQGPGGGGCFFEFTNEARTPLSRWQPLERLVARSS
jgi:broad specificity phosphatase PhoE